MNVLLVVPGGVDASAEVAVIPTLLNVCRELAKQHRVFIIALHQDRQLQQYQLLGCQVVSLAMVKTTNLCASLLITMKRLQHFDFRPDIIHGFWLGKPSVLAGLLSLRYRVPLLASIAGGEAMNLVDIHYGGSQSLIARGFNRLSLLLANRCSCGSRYVAAIAKQRWAINPSLIPLGIDGAFWPSQMPPPTPPANKPWQLIHIASINRVKAPFLLLNVVKELKQAGYCFILHWVGEDTLDGAVQLQAAQLDLSEQIWFHGFKRQVELKAMLLAQPAHFIMQTSYFESQGIAMAEACSQGACPVGTDVGWLNDLGLGLEPTNEAVAKALANQIIELSQCYSDRAVRVATAQQWIKTHDLSATMRLFNQLYAELTSKP